MKKLLSILFLFILSTFLYAAPTKNTQTTIEKPNCNIPNAKVLDLTRYTIKDKIYISDFSNNSNFLLTLYFFNGTEWILASRYEPADATTPSKKLASSPYTSIINNTKETDKDSLKDKLAIEIDSFYTDNLSQFQFAAITISDPSITINYGEHNQDLYIILSREPEINKAVNNCTIIETNTIDTYHMIPNNGKEIKRNILKGPYLVNISTKKDFCCSIYAKKESESDYTYIGITYFTKIGQKTEAIPLSPALLEYDAFYLVTDNNEKFNVKAEIKKNNLFFIIQ